MLASDNCYLYRNLATRATSATFSEADHGANVAAQGRDSAAIKPEPRLLRRVSFAASPLDSRMVKANKTANVSRCGQTSIFISFIMPPRKLKTGTQVLLEEGNKMKPSTKNEIAGKLHEVKGSIRQKAGQLTNEPDLEGKGIGERVAGKIQKKVGELEKIFEKP